MLKLSVVSKHFTTCLKKISAARVWKGRKAIAESGLVIQKDEFRPKAADILTEGELLCSY